MNLLKCFVLKNKNIRFYQIIEIYVMCKVLVLIGAICPDKSVIIFQKFHNYIRQNCTPHWVLNWVWIFKFNMFEEISPAIKLLLEISFRNLCQTNQLKFDINLLKFLAKLQPHSVIINVKSWWSRNILLLLSNMVTYNLGYLF